MSANPTRPRNANLRRIARNLLAEAERLKVPRLPHGAVAKLARKYGVHKTTVKAWVENGVDFGLKKHRPRKKKCPEHKTELMLARDGELFCTACSAVDG